MEFFRKRNIAVGLIALVIGTFAFIAVAKAFFQSSTTVTGNIAAFILNPEGKPDGAILNTGDQVHFGPQTGQLVASQIKVGDALTVTGRTGYKTNYGREMRAETVQINGNTITVLNSRPAPPARDGGGPDGKGKPMPPRDRAGRPGKDQPMPPATGDEKADGAQPNADYPVEDAAGGNAPNVPQPVAASSRQAVSANGSVRFVLVGGRGEARGLILTDGTQVMLPREVNNANLTLNEQTAVSIEGTGAKSEYGTFVHPTRLTIGTQTFSFNR